MRTVSHTLRPVSRDHSRIMLFCSSWLNVCGSSRPTTCGRIVIFFRRRNSLRNTRSPHVRRTQIWRKIKIAATFFTHSKCASLEAISDFWGPAPPEKIVISSPNVSVSPRTTNLHTYIGFKEIVKYPNADTSKRKKRVKVYKNINPTIKTADCPFSNIAHDSYARDSCR